MSKVWARPEFHGFRGWRGQNVRLNPGEEYDTSSELYQDHPDWFTDVDPNSDEQAKPRRRGGRRG
jgi:hypothetical protein